MGQLLTLKPTGGDLDRLTAVQRVEEALSVAQMLFGQMAHLDVYDAYDVKRVRAVLPQAKDIVATGALTELSDEFRKATQQATKKQIGQNLAALVAAFPNAGKSDLGPYGAMLAADVASKYPTFFALEIACRQLRQTSRFLPSISEVLEAIADAEGRVKNHRWTLENFHRYLTQTEAYLDQRDADLESERIRAVERAERKAAGVGTATQDERR